MHTASLNPALTYTVKEVCQLHHVFSYFCFTLPKIFKLQDKETWSRREEIKTEVEMEQSI